MALSAGTRLGPDESLRTITAAVSAALTRMARWHVWWDGTGELPLDVEVRLTDECFTVKASADEVRTALLAYQAEAISFETFYERLQAGGWARQGVDAEEEHAAIAREVGE